MAVRECVRCAWEQETSPLSMPSGVAVWTLGVAQHECLSPRVPSHLRIQHGREIGAERKYQILRETRQIWSGDFWNDKTCLWKWGSKGALRSRRVTAHKNLCSCDRASWAKREERIPTRCNNIDDLLSIADIDYSLQSRHVSGIFMPIIRRKDHVLLHM